MRIEDHVPRPWEGLLEIADTHLHIRDSGGSGPAILYLNGCFAAQRSWRRVVRALEGEAFRHIRFDARGRGRSAALSGARSGARSASSSDYSFQACLDDISRVLNHRKVNRALLVGWSYGATLAVYWAKAHQERCSGIVAIDGALPFGLTDEAGKEHIRRLFRRIAWLFPIARLFGLAGSMNAAQHAQINIEANEKTAYCGAVLAELVVPTFYVLGSGGHLGASEEIMKQGRATLDPLLKRNPNLSVFAKVSSNHAQILRRDALVVAQAIRELSRHSSMHIEPTEQS